MFKQYREETPNKRKERQQSAQERSKVYAVLSVAEKIALVKSRPGKSKRELARLEKQLGGQK